MTLNSMDDRMRTRGQQASARLIDGGSQIPVTHAPTFIIGNKAFFVAVKRALDVSGRFHIVGAFRKEDLRQSLRRSLMLGQKPMVCVIHEPSGERKDADDAAHAVLKTYPRCGIVLISGDELEANAERKIAAHDFNATVVSEATIRNPKSLATAARAAMTSAGFNVAA